ncbi:MAG: GAF domain-containing protein [Chloroflexi bacterium]|nr:GAF domain-containing protein [Chloroflexota bacterium]
MAIDYQARALQILESCKITGASWAAWVECTPEGWRIALPDSLEAGLAQRLQGRLAAEDFGQWLESALARAPAPAGEGLACARIYAYGSSGGSMALLVGADRLGRSHDDLYRLLAMTPPEGEGQELFAAQPEFMKPLNEELHTAYQLDRALDQVLTTLTNLLDCDAAYLAIRLGDIYRIESTWNCPAEVHGLEISPESSGSSAALTETQEGLIQGGEHLEAHIALIGGALPRPPRTIMKAPVVVGTRMIGKVVLISTRARAYNEASLKLVGQYLRRAAYTIENAILFFEAARYLGQYALLNEIALAASGGLSAQEIASRVSERLARVFHADQAEVLLLAGDGQTLARYGQERESDAEGNRRLYRLGEQVIQSAQPLRIADWSASRPEEGGSASILMTPLKYRGAVIGAMGLYCARVRAFTAQDEQLLAAISSQLAGIFENARLHQDGRERSAKLTLIHQVVLEVAGLSHETEIARITAELMADFFNYELVEVMLLDEASENLVSVGLGGSKAASSPANYTQAVSQGIMGKVFRSGVGAYFNRVSDLPEYLGFPGWVAGSELCVPLKDGERTIGLVNIECADRDFFTESDLLLMESLAGILSSVLASARHNREMQKRIEAQRLAENRLIRSARLAAVGEMAAGIAHELNNPLTTVMGFIELILEELSADSPYHADLELALSEAQRAREVVRRLLDFSRQSANVRAASDLNELLREVLALMQHQIQTGGVEIHLDMDDLPAISVNPNQIKQVFLNLLQNALQAMPGGGDLWVRSMVEPRGEGLGMSVKICDSGEGIPIEYQERIFEPFFTTRPVGKGTGLGLSVSYGIITSHGGHIEVASDPGKGSCFTVWLPWEGG